jgi:hypothetical protein
MGIQAHAVSMFCVSDWLGEAFRRAALNWSLL